MRSPCCLYIPHPVVFVRRLMRLPFSLVCLSFVFCAVRVVSKEVGDYFFLELIVLFSIFNAIRKEIRYYLLSSLK
jgi:hypothetical protein